MIARIHLYVFLLASLVSAQQLNKAPSFQSPEGLENKNAALSIGVAVYEEQYRRLGQAENSMVRCCVLGLAVSCLHCQA
jgi:hypothetical protein